MLPYRAWEAGVRKIIGQGTPYVFYIHPWELDPGQPRVDGLNRISRFRHYLNLDRSEARYRALVSGFEWTTIGRLLQHWEGQPA
jgi:hypothetical protein